MKISYNWLKQYTGLDIAPDKLSIILTDCGLEVEAMEHIGINKSRLQGVVVGYVLQKTKHPNADKLSLTQVDIGQSEPLSIVCGAANVAPHQKVLVATIGTRIVGAKGEFVIQQSKIRGEVSQGMICAEDELGLGDSHSGIMILNDDAPIGQAAAEYLQGEDDVVFEIGLTPNRCDATSHIGVARDIIAVVNSRSDVVHALLLPDVSAFTVDNNTLPIEIAVEDTQACPRYTGITLSGVTVADSPDWLQQKLKAIGLRPINNIVDITNYVLFETGQPLHAFDADGIVGNKVLVKKLDDKTKFTTLDGVQRELSQHDLMICNASEPMCIAGVFGGEHSGVTHQTTRVFLESAYFNPTSVRKTSKFHALKTDASFRFERGADPNITVYAIKRAALLIKEIAGGSISSNIVDVYPVKIADFKIDFSLSRMDNLIGKHIEKEMVVKILNALQIKIVADQGDVLQLEVPPFKTDVTRAVDVVEEVLRIYGYNHVEFGDDLRSSISFFPKPDPEKVQNIIADYLTSIGFFEIMTNSLTKSDYYENNAELFEVEKLVRLLNPLSKELNVMRQTMLFSGLESVAFNKNHKNGNIFFYEFGKVYFKNESTSPDPRDKYGEYKHLALFVSGNIHDQSWNTAEQKADFYYIKALVDQIIKRLGIDIKQFGMAENQTPALFTEQLTYKMNDTVVCEFGKLHPHILKQTDIKDPVFYAWLNWDVLFAIPKQPIAYREVSRFPEVKRDLALLLNKSIKYKEIEKIAFETEPLLIKRVSLFDIYEGEKIGEGKKSYAVSFILQDEERTLTDERIDACMNKLIAAYAVKLEASLR
ncbi:MAG: phenylalanine--tRNA ligase subunit beta [Bacteroidota bacterium]